MYQTDVPVAMLWQLLAGSCLASLAGAVLGCAGCRADAERQTQ